MMFNYPFYSTKNLRNSWRRPSEIFIVWVFLTSFFISIQAVSVTALDFEYIYDALNRLVGVVDSSGNVITYTYDKVGNITAIERTTLGQLSPPQINSIVPNAVNQHETVSVTLTGTGFLGGQLSTTHPGLSVSGTSGSHTSLTGLITVEESASLGTATLLVTSPVGSDSVSITILPPAPRITTIFPLQASSTGGSTFTLSGSGFTPTTTVTIDGNPATDLQIINDHFLTGKTPTGLPSPPSVDVVVTNAPAGTSTLEQGFTYAFPFLVPNALAMELSGSIALKVNLLEPVPTNLDLNVNSSNPSVATVSSSVNITENERTASIPISPVGEGQTMITVTLGNASADVIVYVGQTDADGDGLPDAVEPFFGSEGGNPDTDGDGTLDGAEDADADGLDATTELATGTIPSNEDTDGDGLLDGTEIQLGTDPLISDTDGDGFSDGDENIAGADPLEATSLPANPMSTIGVAVGRTFTVENANDPTGPSIGEAMGATFTVENANDPTGPSIGEAMGATFTVENANDPTGPSIGEAMGPAFSVDNQISSGNLEE